MYKLNRTVERISDEYVSPGSRGSGTECEPDYEK